MTVPEDIKRKLKNLSEKTGRSMKEIIGIYADKLTSDFVQDDAQFKTEEDKHRYVYQATFVSVASRPPTNIISFIPIGYDEKRRTKTGKNISSIYGFVVNDDDEYTKSKIVCKGKSADLINTIEPFYRYKISVGGKNGLFFADDLSNFYDEEYVVDQDPIDLIVKEWDAKIIDIRKTVDFPSRLDKNGYVDKMDLRIIRGHVISHTEIDRNDGTQGSVYNIGDESIALGNEDEITDSGIIIPNRFTVWCPNQFLIWDNDSMLDFVGYIQHKSKTGESGTEPQMNAICVIPVHGIPIEDEDMEE